MFIIPTSDVLLLGTAITIVLAVLQWSSAVRRSTILVFKDRKVDLAT
jgi:hypothetical protein